MKTTDIRTLVAGNPWKNRVFVIVETDEGRPAHRCTGSATGYYFED